MATSRSFQWTVVGAGPAGIAAVGKLLDAGIPSRQLCWIDPHFDVGLLGRKWSSVSSNTTVKLFEDFLNASAAFRYDQAAAKKFPLHDLVPTDTCRLTYIVEPLAWVTKQLRDQVASYQDYIVSFNKKPEESSWTLQNAAGDLFSTQNVVLATGSKPKEINLEIDSVEVVPLEQAMQYDVLKAQCTAEDRVAVFGSSHSAIMVVRDLLEIGVGKVVNFYKSELLFAELHANGRYINDSTGLKGRTASWARENLMGGSLPRGLERYISTEANIAKHLPPCSKEINAIGFERSPLNVNGESVKSYDPTTGVIDSGLFGVGIAFPEQGPDAVGKVEFQVGLWKFMRYLKRIVPEWIESSSGQ